MSDLNIALILRFIDQATGPARTAMRQVQQFGEQQTAAGRAQVATANANIAALRGQALAVTGIGYAAYAAMRPAVAFEAQMDRVGAVAGASADEQERLTLTARALGRDTAFTAIQAAQGMQALAMAGFDVNETVAAMPGLLNLAAAAGADLGRTSDIASNIMSGFALGADQMGRIGDVLVNTFTSSNTTLDMLGSTMSYVAPQAAAMGISLEQVAAMSGLLGNTGIQGERAGTALRAMLSRLAAPSDEAAEALERLNVQVSDENGNLRDIPTILADMDRSMEGLGDAARQDLMQAIFGTEAAAAALYLMTQAGSGTLQDYEEQLLASGSAAEVAARMNDNAQGALRRLGSAAQDAQIALGNSFLPALAAGAEALVPVVQHAAAWVEANQELIAAAGKVAAVLLAINAAVLVAQGAFWLLFGWVGKARIAFGLLAQVAGAFGLGAAEGAFSTFRTRAAADMAGLATSVDDRAGFIERRIRTMRTRALIGMAATAWNIMNMPEPGDVTDEETRAAQRQQAASSFEGAVRSIPGVESLMGLYERTFSAVHGTDAPVNPALMQGAAMQNAAELVQGYAGRTDLPTTDRIDDMRNATALMREEVAALEAQLDGMQGPADAYDMGSPEWQQVNSELRAARSVLQSLEEELARSEAEATALQNALMVVGETDVAPEISTTSIDRALARVRELSTRMNALNGGTAVPGETRADGARATGGPVRPGFRYFINEMGQELFEPLTAGRIIPAGESRRLMAGAGRALAGGLTIGDINITALAGQDPTAIAREVRRQIEAMAREARFALNDGGYHA